MADAPFSQHLLSRHFEIDPLSPSGLRWKHHRCKCFIGKPAGWLFRPSHTDNYGPLWQVGLKNKKTYAHRVVWTLVNGNIPKGMQIDHINGIPSDNRIENLSLKTANENQWARNKISSQNKTGLHCVSLMESGKQWRAQVKRNGKHILDKCFNSAEEAGRAVDSACKKWSEETASDFRIPNFN